MDDAGRGGRSEDEELNTESRRLRLGRDRFGRGGRVSSSMERVECMDLRWDLLEDGVRGCM